MERALEIGAAPALLSVEATAAIHREIAGQIRAEPSWIGGVDPSRVESVGPPAEEVRGLLEDLCEFMSREDISPVPRRRSRTHSSRRSTPSATATAGSAGA